MLCTVVSVYFRIFSRKGKFAGIEVEGGKGGSRHESSKISNSKRGQTKSKGKKEPWLCVLLAGLCCAGMCVERIDSVYHVSVHISSFMHDNLGGGIYSARGRDRRA